MALGVIEMLWLKIMLEELKVDQGPKGSSMENQSLPFSINVFSHSGLLHELLQPTVSLNVTFKYTSTIETLGYSEFGRILCEASYFSYASFAVDCVGATFG